jgi:transposase
MVALATRSSDRSSTSTLQIKNATVVLGRKAWLFAGSPRGGDRAAFMYSMIVTAKMNDVDPQAWLADMLGRLQDMPLSRLPELLPWNWKLQHMAKAA